MRSFHSSGGGIQVEQPMLPTQPPGSNGVPPSKRKTPEDGDPFGRSNKKAKADTSTFPNGSVKRKVPGEEKVGGLVIVRGPPTRTFEPKRAVSTSRTTPAEDRPINSASSTVAPSFSRINNKPSSSSRLDTTLQSRKGKGHPPTMEEEAEEAVDEDVRQMNSEADELRDRSRASLAHVSPDAHRFKFQFPAPKPPSQANKSRVRQLQAEGPGPGTPPHAGMRDTLIPLVERETPQIVKNKMMRGEHPSMKQATSASQSASGKSSDGSLNLGATSSAQASGHRRRTSMSMRGKRISATFEATGIITKPHASVSDTSLYKHIDTDLPEAERIRQLLIWTTSRALEPQSAAAANGRGRKSLSNKRPPDQDLPPLPPGGDQLLREVEAELIRQIAEKRIDTSGYGGPSEGSSSAWALKENEQNVRNRAREKLFSEQIEERRKEDASWVEVGQFYESHKANVLASLSQQRKARTSLSAKAKGKQRATSIEPEDLEPWESELPEQFRGSKGYDVARYLLQAGIEGVSKGDPRRKDLLYMEDCLHSAVKVAHELMQITASELDRRFELLSISLAQNSTPSTNPSSSHKQSTISNFVPLPSAPSTRNLGLDPQDLLSAISRTDAARPRSQLGDAARRAAKDVQRANESVVQGGEHSQNLSERRLKDVPPPTPRKAPGTPKRPTTPRSSRR